MPCFFYGQHAKNIVRLKHKARKADKEDKMEDSEYEELKKKFSGSQNLTQMSDEEKIKYASYLEEDLQRTRKELEKLDKKDRQSRKKSIEYERHIKELENSKNALLKSADPGRRKIPKDFQQDAPEAVGAVFRGVNDENAKRGMTERQKRKADAIARKAYQKYMPNRNNAAIIEFGKTYGLQDHYLEYDEKKGIIIDHTASSNYKGNNAVVGKVETDRLGNITAVTAYKSTIADIKVQEDKAMNEAAEEASRFGIDPESLTMTFNHGFMNINDSMGRNVYNKPFKKPFRKKEIKEHRTFAFEQKGDEIIAKVRTGMEKIADKMMSPLEVVASKMEGQERDETPAFKKYTYVVGGEEFDYDNMKYVTMAILGDTFDGLGIKRNSAGITMNIDGSGVITGRLNDKEVELAVIDGSHEVTINSEDKILIQAGVTKDDIKKDSKDTYTEPLFTPPEKTEAVAVIVDKTGEHMVTVDYMEKGDKERPVGYDDKGLDKAYEKRVEDAIKTFSIQAGVDPSDIYLVQGCRYVVTKSGKQLGILNNDGSVLADYETIDRSNTLAEVGKEAGRPWGNLTADSHGNVTFMDNPYMAVATLTRDDAGNMTYTKAEGFDVAIAQEKVLDEMISSVNSRFTEKADRDSFMFNENGDIVSKDFPDRPIGHALIGNAVSSDNSTVINAEGLQYEVNPKEFINIVKMTRGEFTYDGRMGHGAQEPVDIVTGEPVRTGNAYESNRRAHDTDKENIPPSTDEPINDVGPLYHVDENGNHILNEEPSYDDIQDRLADGAMDVDDIAQVIGSEGIPDSEAYEEDEDELEDR